MRLACERHSGNWQTLTIPGNPRAGTCWSTDHSPAAAGASRHTEGEAVAVDVQGHSAGVTGPAWLPRCSLATVTVKFSAPRVGHGRAHSAGTRRGALEVKSVPIQGDVMGSPQA